MAKAASRTYITPIDEQLSILSTFFKIAKLRDELTPPQPPVILETEQRIFTALTLGIQNKSLDFNAFAKAIKIDTKEAIGEFADKFTQVGKVAILTDEQRTSAVNFLIENIERIPSI